MEDNLKVLIAGDFFVSSDIETKGIVSNDIVNLFNESDLSILNFEAPLKDALDVKPTLKTGPNLFMDSKNSISLLKRLNIQALTLANNHIMDYGEKALEFTLKQLNKNGFNTVGAGKSNKEASQTLYLKKNNITIAVINVGENEWGVAELNKPGMHGFDLIDTVNQIKEAKDKADKVIVIYHGGNEYYKYPRPNLVKTCRFLADQGADLIACHHTHTISGYETYNDVPIFYGLGNFLFTRKSNFKSSFSGLVLELNISRLNSITFNIIPVEQDDKTYKLSFHSNQETIFNELNEVNSVISNCLELNDKWVNFSKGVSKSYLSRFSLIGLISNDFFRKGFTKIGLGSKLLNRYFTRNLLNYIRCESHREVILEFFKHKI